MSRIAARLLAALVLSAAAMPAAAQAQIEIYHAAVSGSQTVTWAVDGTQVSGCETRQGTGNGKVTFTYRTTRLTLATANSRGYGGKFAFDMGARMHAHGSQTGTFTDSPAGSTCVDLTPEPPFTSDASACGATDFWLGGTLRAAGAFAYLYGGQLFGPGLADRPNHLDFRKCPFGTDFTSGDADRTDACNVAASAPIWQTTGEVNDTWGRGLVNYRFPASAAAFTNPKKRVTVLTRHITRTCVLPSSYAGGVRFTVDASVTLKLTRHQHVG